MSLVVLFSASPAFTVELQSKIDPEKFGYCLAQKVTQKYSMTEINKRLDIDEDDQKKIVIQESHPNGGGPSYFFEYMPSIGLADVRNNDFPSAYSEIELYRLFSYYDSKLAAGDGAISRADYLAQKNMKTLQHPPKRADRKIYSYKRIHLHFLANPILTWLLNQPDESVSHWSLLNFATEVMSGDTITALAVIREIFYEEATYLNSLVRTYPNFKFSRNQVALLGKKLVPLIAIGTNSDQKYDTVGSNYHYWHYLTLKMRERGHYGLNYGISLLDSRVYKGGVRGQLSGFSDKLGLDTAWYFQVWLQRIVSGSSDLSPCSLK